MKCILLFITMGISSSASANWYYLNFKEDAKTPEQMCVDLGVKETPQASLKRYIGKRPFNDHASYTFSDKSEMLVLSTGDSVFIYANRASTCRSLRDSINDVSKGEVFVAGMCENPKKSGTVEMEIAASLAKYGSDRIKVGVIGSSQALLEFRQENGEIAPIFLSSTKSKCIEVTDLVHNSTDLKSTKTDHLSENVEAK